MELLCSHAEIGSQASLSRWCPMGVRVQVSLVALNYTLVAQLGERLFYTQGVRGSNPLGSTTYPLSSVMAAHGIVIPLVRVRISAGGLKSKTV